MDIVLKKFFTTTQAISIATHNAKEVWVATVYVGVAEDGTIYFISSKQAKHSQLILQNPHIAFSLVWFDPDNHKNRKGIQGKGRCMVATEEAEITEGVLLHNQHFPEFKNRISVDWIHTNERESCVWKIIPSYIKYWDDELYQSDGYKEFFFDTNQK